MYVGPDPHQQQRREAVPQGRLDAILPEGSHFDRGGSLHLDMEQIVGVINLSRGDARTPTTAQEWGTSTRIFQSKGLAILESGVRSHKGGLIGFAEVVYEEEKPKSAEFVELAVDPYYTGQAVEQAMIADLMVRAGRAGIISFVVRLEEATPRDAYEAVGFRELPDGYMGRGFSPQPVLGLK